MSCYAANHGGCMCTGACRRDTSPYDQFPPQRRLGDYHPSMWEQMNPLKRGWQCPACLTVHHPNTATCNCAKLTTPHTGAGE